MITLYDIPLAIGAVPWSPNTFRTRTALLFKGLPFKTEWVEYPDIGAKMNEIEAEPTGKWEDGSPKWTLPVIKDDSTGEIIGDSWKIAVYLDNAYPATPLLFPFGARAPILLFQTYFHEAAIAPGRRIVLPEVHSKLSARSQEHFRRTREVEFKMKLEEFAPPGPIRADLWDRVKAGYEKIAAIYASNGNGELSYFYGEKLSYADLLIVSHLSNVRSVLGPEHPEWKEVECWNEGRWAKLLELTSKYHAVSA